MTATHVRNAKQMLVSEIYLERLLSSRVPAAETVLGALMAVAVIVGFVRDVGVAIWIATALVGLPLTLRLAARPSSGPASASVPWLRALAVPAAAVSLLSLPVAGFLGMVLSLPWLALTLLVSMAGLFRFLSRSSPATAMTAMDIGLMAVGISGLAYTLSRLGIDALAAIELHALVYVVPVVAADAARRIESPWWMPLVPALGTPVAALLTTFDGPTRIAGQAGLVVCMAIVSVLVVRLGARTGGVVKVTLGIAGLCLTAGVLAIVVAQTILPELDLDEALVDRTRSAGAPLMAIGFTLPALLGLLQLPIEKVSRARRTMFHLGPPTREQRSRLVDDLFSQAPRADLNPLAVEPPAGYRLHRQTRPVVDFENSCEALWTWAGHEAAGIDITPHQPPILMGQNLLFTVPVGPLTITATGRVAALISDEDHYGYVLTTLDHHPFVGTEVILLDKSSGEATVTISTIWRPNCVGAWLFGPLTGRLLTRIARRYLDGIAEAETAAVGAHLVDLMSAVSQRQYAISRDSVLAESAVELPQAEAPEVPTKALSEYEALFATPFDSPTEEDLDPDQRTADPDTA